MSLFPSLKPQISNKIWFQTTRNEIVPNETELKKQEDEYKAKLDAEVKQGEEIVPLGQTKQKNNEPVEGEGGAPDDGIDVDDEDSDDDIDEDTDEFDTASNGIDSAEEIITNSAMNETNEEW